MQLFMISSNPARAAMHMVDTHINKQILETAQILDGGTRCLMFDRFPRLTLEDVEIVKIPKTHANNPVILSARRQAVWEWAWHHLHALLLEKEHRWGTPHLYASNGVLDRLLDRFNNTHARLHPGGFHVAMGEDSAPDADLTQAVTLHRANYAHNKMRYGKRRLPVSWTKRPVPRWIRDWHKETSYTLELAGDRTTFHTGT